jgi:hypothetical protein
VATEPKIILNLTRASVLCDTVVIADRPRPRMRGLLGQRSLPAGEGMLLQPAPSIHTAFMRFPIDVVFMDGTLRVLKIVEGMKPWRAASAHRAWAVLEMAAGEVARCGTEVGDQLGVVEVSDRLGRVAGRAGSNDGNLSALRRVVANWNRTESRDAARSEHAQPEPARDDAEAARVLIVGSDRRFRAVTAALLTRRGFTVSLGERTGSIAELAKHAGADVVVLDAGDSITRAAHDVAAITALSPSVGVVIVAERGLRGLSSLPVVSKWGSFDALISAIEQAGPKIKVPSDVRG